MELERVKSELDRIEGMLSPVYIELDRVSALVLKDEPTNEVTQEVLASCSEQNQRIRDIRQQAREIHMAIYQRIYDGSLDVYQRELVNHYLQEIIHFETHAQALQDSLKVALDSAIGLSSLKHERITKLFTVVGTAVFPPTLVASIYGMNLDIPTVLLHPWVVVGTLVASFLIPLIWVKVKGWTK